LGPEIGFFGWVFKSQNLVTIMCIDIKE
jgi:hypothetical protein